MIGAGILRCEINAKQSLKMHQVWSSKCMGNFTSIMTIWAQYSTRPLGHASIKHFLNAAYPPAYLIPESTDSCGAGNESTTPTLLRSFDWRVALLPVWSGSFDFLSDYKVFSLANCRWIIRCSTLSNRIFQSKGGMFLIPRCRHAKLPSEGFR